MNSHRGSFSHSTVWHDHEANKEKDLEHLKASLRKNKGLPQLCSIYCIIILNHYCTLKVFWGFFTTGARTISRISRRAELISTLDHTLWRSDLWPLWSSDVRLLHYSERWAFVEFSSVHQYLLSVTNKKCLTETQGLNPRWATGALKPSF